MLEFFNTIQYLGGQKVTNFVRGPMNFGMGEIRHFNFSKVNLSGPSKYASSKLKIDYTTESGVHKVLVQSLHKLTKHTFSSLIVYSSSCC